jgi:hypothetical protein
MNAAEFNELMTAFKAQTTIQPSKNDPFSMSLFVQYIIASNLSGLPANTEAISTALADINENLTNIETKLQTLATKLDAIETAIRTHV